MEALILQRWIGAPDFPPESAGTGLTSLKRKRRTFEKCISFNVLRLRFRLVASDFPGIVCILDGDRCGAVELNAFLLRKASNLLLKPSPACPDLQDELPSRRIRRAPSSLRSPAWRLDASLRLNGLGREVPAGFSHLARWRSLTRATLGSGFGLEHTRRTIPRRSARWLIERIALQGAKSRSLPPGHSPSAGGGVE